MYDVDGILLDLDNHLVPYRGLVLPRPVEARIHTLKELGYAVVLGTNNPEDRTHMAKDGTFYVSRTHFQLAKREGKPHISFYDEVCSVTGISAKRFLSSGDNWLRDTYGALMAHMQGSTTDRFDGDPWFEKYFWTRWRETRVLLQNYQILRIDGHTIDVPDKYLLDFAP
jgi:predicted HAD superfamily phosphohydrolase YqeG